MGTLSFLAIPALIALPTAASIGGQDGEGVDGVAPSSEALPLDVARLGPSALESVGPESVEFSGTLAAHVVKTSGTPDGTGNLFGTDLTAAIFAIEGRYLGFDFSYANEFASNNTAVLDRVWVQTALDDRHALRIGRFRSPFLWSSAAGENEFLFPERSRLGREFASSDQGLMLRGDHGPIEFQIALTNGGDGTGDARSGVARLGLHTTDERIVPGERSRGPDGAAIFLAYADDGSLAEGDALATELHVQFGRNRLFGEFANAAVGLGDQRAFGATWSVAIDDGQTELALRTEQFTQPVRRTTIGAAMSFSFVRDVARAQVAVERVQGSGSTQDGWIFSIGTVLAL